MIFIRFHLCFIINLSVMKIHIFVLLVLVCLLSNFEFVTGVPLCKHQQRPCLTGNAFCLFSISLPAECFLAGFYTSTFYLKILG